MTRLVYLAQSAADLPADNDWLSDAERDFFARFRVDKRRRDWLLGRWTAKLALATHPGRDRDDLRRWEILPDRDRAPRVLRDGDACAQRISISHSGGTALCAVSADGGAIGCDLEQIAPRDWNFVETFFTAAEQESIGDDETGRSVIATLLWSAKESVLKAVLKGLSVDTRSVEVEPPPTLAAPDTWQPLRARQVSTGRLFDGWWRRDERFVWTLFGDHDGREPRALAAVVQPSRRINKTSGWR